MARPDNLPAATLRDRSEENLVIIIPPISILNIG
jgi:hypothetical protein